VDVVNAGAPIMLSMPHFYRADSSYQHAVDGLTPNITHLTYLDIEPVSKDRLLLLLLPHSSQCRTFSVSMPDVIRANQIGL